MKKFALDPKLHYLYKTPSTIYWKIITGPPNRKLSVLEDHDLIYDEKDLKIRRLI